MTNSNAPQDDTWAMVEEAVHRLFADLGRGRNHATVGDQLAELGWAEIESEYPVEADELLFQAQGRSLAVTDCLDRVMIAELAAVLGEPVDAVLLPHPRDGIRPRSSEHRVTGIIQGPARGRVAVPVAIPLGGIGVAAVDMDRLQCERLDTFDPSVQWTAVTGELALDVVEADAAWHRAMGAAHRVLATELVALSDQALKLVVEHASARVQFGGAIGSFQAPRHALADVAASLESARALLSQSWRFGGQASALAAKAVAGRVHRSVSDTTMQVCGAIGVTAEHDLHRYVRRGIQLDGLCGSYQQLEAELSDTLFEATRLGESLPTITAGV